MAIARFEPGVDFRTLFSSFPPIPTLSTAANVSVSAIGLTPTVYPDEITFISDGGISTVYPAFFGTGMAMVDGHVTAGTLSAYHHFDGADYNEYVSGLSLDATLINLIIDGDPQSFKRALFAGDDKIRLASGTAGNFVLAGTGRDRVSGSAGNDTLYGEDGSDRLIGGGGQDHLSGGAGSDTASGGLGNDILVGGRGSDRLFGNAGNDLLQGAKGFDRLAGGAGNDTLRGGTGADHFVFTLNDGQDEISDFEDGIDKILLSANHGTVSLAFEDTGPDVLVTFNSTEILIKNIAFDQISQFDFQVI